MKRIITVLTAILLALSAVLGLTVTGVDINLYGVFRYDDTFTLGDVNGDDSVDGKDALTLKATVAGLEGYELILSAADIDADGDASAKDSYFLKLILSGGASAEDFENGRPVYRLTVAGRDISEYSFVLEEGITDEDNAYVSYLLFMRYIERLVGVTLPVSYGEAETEKAIYIEQLDFWSEEGQRLGADGLRYTVEDGDMYLYGTFRGTMYAVYEILEKYFGVRFMSNTETFVYKSRTVDIPEGTDVEYVPQMNFRFAGHTYGTEGAIWHYLAHKLNGSQLYGFYEPRWGTQTGPLWSNAHSFAGYWQMGTGTMPEDDGTMTLEERYKAKMATGEDLVASRKYYTWQPCATANSAYNILFQGMLDCNAMELEGGRRTPFFKEGITLFSFSLLDNQNYCTCRNCSRISKEEGYSGLYLALYNRAAADVQEYYPGVRLYGIIYAKDFPKTVKPDKNLVLMYCGLGCDNHILGMEECCPEGGQLNGMTKDLDEEALTYWGNACKETGAELWFWIYPVTYGMFLSGCPNIPNLYYNLKWMVDNANVTGFYYEGGGPTYNFEALKAYVTAKFMWDTDMTYEEWTAHLKEFIYMYYGGGVEEIYEYIMMQTEAGDRCGTCFINNFDRLGDMYSYEYLAENYEYMRGLLESAMDKVTDSSQIYRIETLIICCDFMGLSSVYDDWYTNGTQETKRLYCNRYTEMYNKIKSYGMEIMADGAYVLPATVDYTVNPMTQFYEFGSRRPGIKP